MSEITITKESIQKYIDNKLKELDEIHEKIKNNFKKNYCYRCNIRTSNKYKDLVDEIDHSINHFYELCYCLSKTN